MASDSYRYIMTLNDIRKRYPCSWIRITTITMLCKVLKEDINLEKIRAAFADGPVRIRRKGALTNGFEWSLKETTFYNQVTVSYKDQYSTKSIKIFPNGSFQVAGCSDLFDCKRVVGQLKFLLQHVLELEEPIPVESFRVVMINTNFSLNARVSLMEVISKLSAAKTTDLKFIVSFNPDRYSAVKVKFQPAPGTKQVTASIFSTGKVIVTGAETLREIALAYETLNRELESTRIQDDPVTDSETNIVMGYPFDQWVKHLSAKGIKRWN